MIDTRTLPEPAPIPDARYQVAVDRRRAWAKSWVNRWYLRRAADKMSTLGYSVEAAAAAFRHIGMSFADWALVEEVDRMWDDALPRLQPQPFRGNVPA